MGSKLDDLGIKYNTDKASVNCGHPEHDYLRHYEIFLRDFVKNSFALVELGSEYGHSLRMWEEYFPKATIIGVDLNPNVESLNTERIQCIYSDAIADDLPAKIKQKTNKDIKCIIDDCSHAWSSQRISFENLFPILASGGYYIIEDLECGTLGAYPQFPLRTQDSQVFFEYALDRMRILRVSENRNPISFRPFFHELPQKIQEIERSIDMAMIIPGAVIFKKK